jgi:hypothetical protein
VQTSPPRSPAESFATLLRCLGHAVVAMMGGERLTLQVIALIMTRIREINQRFKRLAAHLAAGTYKPRRYLGRKAAEPKPRRRNPLFQKFGWLLPLVPEAVQYRAQLEHLLLRDPAMAALIQSAPAPMARVLRPLCWMLHLEPPPILARPAVQATPPRPKTPPRSPPPTPQPEPPAPAARPAPPALPVARACGPPLPA